MRLNQYVSIRGDRQKQATETSQTARAIFSKPGLLSGMHRTYQAKNDEGEPQPAETTVVQHRGPEVLRELAADLASYWDAEATVDEANCTAKANVVVNDKVILENAPTTLLMFLKGQLDDLDGLVHRLPTLDPSQEWGETPDPTGYWRTKPVETVRTKKVPTKLVKYEATKEHAAQVDVFHDDVAVGTWTRVEVSSAFPMARVLQIQGRIRALRQAIDVALHEANTMTAVERKIGGSLIEYLLAA